MRFFSEAAKWLARAAIHGYKVAISPLIGPSCRFYPSCSDYALEAFQKKSFFQALKLSIKRLSKCHGWHPGGHDPLL